MIIVRCPIRSATLDQYGVLADITIDAVALNAPAKAYESVAATTIKMSASESMEIGIRPIRAAIENFIAPGVRKRVVYAENMVVSL